MGPILFPAYKLVSSICLLLYFFSASCLLPERSSSTMRLYDQVHTFSGQLQPSTRVGYVFYREREIGKRQ